MTTFSIQEDSYDTEQSGAYSLVPARRAKASDKWLGTADEIFAYLERHDQERELEKDAWWRSMSATLALLRHAQHMIAQAEDKISALENLATLDPLTGLSNRRGFFEAFVRELDRARRNQSEGGLLMFAELENYATICRSAGPEAGEAALRLFANVLETNSRAMDVPARLDGDEFVILMANTPRKRALGRAQNLIKTLNTLRLEHKGRKLRLHASLSLKEYSPGDTLEGLFQDARDYTRKGARAHA